MKILKRAFSDICALIAVLELAQITYLICPEQKASVDG